MNPLKNHPHRDMISKAALGALVMLSVFVPDPVSAVMLMTAAAIAGSQLNHLRGAKWYTVGLVIWAVEELMPNGLLLIAGTALCFIGAGIDIYDNNRNGKGGGPGKGDPQLTREGEAKVRTDREQRAPRHRPVPAPETG